MNERMAAKIFLGLSAGLIAAEALLVSLFGLNVAAILLCFIIFVGLSGMVFSLSLILQKADEIETVSMRRARAFEDEGMESVLKGYDVDEEFLGGGMKRNKKPSKSGTPCNGETTEAQAFGNRKSGSSLEEIITEHAVRFGGLDKLLDSLAKLDDTSFERLLKAAGISGISRDELASVIRTMMEKGATTSGGAQAPEASDGTSALSSFSLDQEGFDEYIKRSMTEGEEKQGGGDAGFSIELDATGLSSAPSPSRTFSHDPDSVISRFKKKEHNT